MEIVDDVVKVQPFVVLTIAIIVLFIGKALNQHFVALREFNISESVSGGLTISIILAAIYFVFQIEVEFDLAARQFLAVYFFTAIGINTKLGDLLAARRPIVTLLAAIIACMSLQDVIAVTMARSLGSAGPQALLAGTVALTGGAETVSTWAPTFVDDFGIADAHEIGIACATFGLLLGSLVGGPIARYLIQRNGLQLEAVAVRTVAPADGRAHDGADYFVFLRSILAIHICIIVAFVLNQLLADRVLALPPPAACFLVAIVLTNLIPVIFPGVGWPSRTLAMSMIAELSLGTLFGMSLISAQLWVIIDLPAEFLTIALVQVAVTVIITTFVIFRIMGRDYDAAIVCSGFAGFALGSTSTAMANMKAVAKHAGVSHWGGKTAFFTISSSQISERARPGGCATPYRTPKALATSKMSKPLTGSSLLLGPPIRRVPCKLEHRP